MLGSCEFLAAQTSSMAGKAGKSRKPADDTSGAMPLYHQSYLVIRQRLNEGVYPPGQPLPSEEEIRQEFGVSRVTIRRALGQLEEEGLTAVLEQVCGIEPRSPLAGEISRAWDEANDTQRGKR